MVVKAKSVPEPSPRSSVPVVAVRPTAPVAEPVTVIASITLAVPKLVVAPAASSALAPAVVIEIVPADGEVDGAGVVQPDTDRTVGRDGEVGDVPGAGGGVEFEAGLGAERGGVDDVDVGDRAAGVAGAAGDAATGPCGSMSRPVTVLPEARSTTSASLSVIVGRLAGMPVCNVTPPTTRLAASPISRWLAFRSTPAV